MPIDTASGWKSLGAGPLMIEAKSTHGSWISFGDTEPTTRDMFLKKDAIEPFNTSRQIWFHPVSPDSECDVAYFPLETASVDSVTVDNGAAITGAAMPAGGSGVLGWLSAIWTKLSGTLAVTTPVGAPVAGAKAVAVTGTAVALGSGALSNGVIIKAKSSNAGSVVVGPSGVTNAVTSSANGYELAPGEAISVAAANLSQVYINGAAGDFVFYAGN